jgi:hypothetical protein
METGKMFMKRILVSEVRMKSFCFFKIFKIVYGWRLLYLQLMFGTFFIKYLFI